MSKRIIDFDAIWTSNKLLRLPADSRAEYLWNLGFAEVNACSDYNPKLIYRDAYNYLRDEYDWTPREIESVYDGFEAAKLIFRFTEDGESYAEAVARLRAEQNASPEKSDWFYFSQTGKRAYCFWIGMEKHLPKKSDRPKYKNSDSIVPLEPFAHFLGEPVESVSRQYRDVLATDPRIGCGAGADAGCGEGLGIGKECVLGTGAGRECGNGESRDSGSSFAAHPQPLPSSMSYDNILDNSGTNTKQHQEQKHQQPAKPEDESKAALVSACSRSIKPAQVPDHLFPGFAGEPDYGINREILAGKFADWWKTLMNKNPNADPSKQPRKWRNLWIADFEKLVKNYQVKDVTEMIAYTQLPRQQQYFVRPATLVEKASELYKEVESFKQKRSWEFVWIDFKTKCGELGLVKPVADSPTLDEFELDEPEPEPEPEPTPTRKLFQVEEDEL